MMMKRILLLFCVILCLVARPGLIYAQEKGNVILVILAHPDDETTIGAMMAKYAAAQNKVYYIVASDGRYGIRINKLSPDTLVKIRAAECACSCKQLGIEAPIMLGFHDGLGTKTWIGEYFRQTRALKDSLKARIEAIRPTLIITFGPDGDSGHPDHRIVGDIVTELILKEDWYEKYPLYYLGWTKEQASKFGIEELNYLDKKYFTTSVSFSDEDEAKFFGSIRCYKSQNTPEEIDEWIATEKKDTSNILYFRRFYVSMDKSETETLIH